MKRFLKPFRSVGNFRKGKSDAAASSSEAPGASAVPAVTSAPNLPPAAGSTPNLVAAQGSEAERAAARSQARVARRLGEAIPQGEFRTQAAQPSGSRLSTASNASSEMPAFKKPTAEMKERARWGRETPPHMQGQESHVRRDEIGRPIARTSMSSFDTDRSGSRASVERQSPNAPSRAPSVGQRPLSQSGSISRASVRSSVSDNEPALPASASRVTLHTETPSVLNVSTRPRNQRSVTSTTQPQPESGPSTLTPQQAKKKAFEDRRRDHERVPRSALKAMKTKKKQAPQKDGPTQE